MFIDLLSESCEEGEKFSVGVTKMSQYFEDKFFQFRLNFWVIFYKLFQLRSTGSISSGSFQICLSPKDTTTKVGQ